MGRKFKNYRKQDLWRKDRYTSLARDRTLILIMLVGGGAVIGWLVWLNLR